MSDLLGVVGSKQISVSLLVFFNTSSYGRRASVVVSKTN